MLLSKPAFPDIDLEELTGNKECTQNAQGGLRAETGNTSACLSAGWGRRRRDRNGRWNCHDVASYGEVSIGVTHIFCVMDTQSPSVFPLAARRTSSPSPGTSASRYSQRRTEIKIKQQPQTTSTTTSHLHNQTLQSLPLGYFIKTTRSPELTSHGQAYSE